MKHWGWWLVWWVMPTVSAVNLVVNTFSSQDTKFNRLTTDDHSGHVYVGAVNRLYQLMADLELVQEVETGPSLDSPECSVIECPATAEKKLTDNVNKALVIDRTQGKLISCGSLSQGVCTVRSLENIKNDIRKVQEPVVANNANASTVAFIAPGPSDQTRDNPLVLYVGVTYTGNSFYRAEVPAVSSRSLNPDNVFQFAKISVTTSTRMFLNSLSREKYPIHYVFGFSHEGFSYFLTIQMKFSNGGPSTYISKLVRVCQNDPDYYSYTEIPLECKGGNGEDYSLVQAAYMGKPGSKLASELGISAQDDAVFAVFSKPSAEYSRHPKANSGLCIYSLKIIRRVFMQNIQKCFRGIGNYGLSFISALPPCVSLRSLPITEDFCGMDVNSPLGGEMAVRGTTAMTWNEHLTAVAATSTSEYTVVFLGTANGHLKKVVVGSGGSAQEYSDAAIDEGSAVNPDLRFDKERMHLYVMTERKVSKVKLQGCHTYSSCSECFGARDPYCGWSSLENKCGVLNNSRSPYWTSYKDDGCITITSVAPKHIQKSTSLTLQLEIENLPLTLNAELQCAFTAEEKTLLTEATRNGATVNCFTPRTDLLPNTRRNQHHLPAILSLRIKDEHDFVATNFTFFDCNTYRSCTECVGADFPCDWCVDGHRCTHDTAENCRNDILITGVSRIGPSIRSGPSYCPRINSTSDGGTEILAPRGSTQKIKVRVDNIAQFIVQTRFNCQFNVEGEVIIKEARLLGDTIYCDDTVFTYNSSEPNITATLDVLWGNSKLLDNPDNIHVLIYRCEALADSCGGCLDLPEKYGCVWCKSTLSCSCEISCDEVGSCPTVTSIIPNQLQRTVARLLSLEVENLPSTLNEELECTFTARGKTLLTPATKRGSVISCYTPRSDLLPDIQRHLKTILSVRLQGKHDFVATNFTFFDCNLYNSCTRCVSSDFPCDWCIDGHRCTHDSAENCRNDILVTGLSRIGPSIRSGPEYCPRISSIGDEGPEIVAAWGSTHQIQVGFDIATHYMVNSRFECEFGIEGQVTTKKAMLVGNAVYCDEMTFTYDSPRPNVTATLAVIWGKSKPVDNPDNIHVLIYRCEAMAETCSDCVALPEKYGCGWCQSTARCDVTEQCDLEWRNDTCQE